MVMRWLTSFVGLAILFAEPASGAKWVNGCPAVKEGRAVVGRGGTVGSVRSISKYFEHVGHEVTFQIPQYPFGTHATFPTEPDALTLEVTFTPLADGAWIPLPPVPVTATSPYALTVVVPDTRPILGRLVVGPARFVVKHGTTLLFEARKMFILPPMNDVAALAVHSYDGAYVEVLAAMDKAAHLWIPLGFEGFGQGESLPECPTVLTPVTPFAVHFDLKKGEDQAFPYVSFGLLKRHKLFLGDYLLDGKNMYGNKLKTKLNTRPLAQKGVVMCSKNDALQLVLFISLTNPALGKKSELLQLAREGSPMRVKIEDISTDPQVAAVLERAQYDSAMVPCYPAP